MKRLLLSAWLLCLSVAIMAQAKYVFFFIGDGMGANQVLAAEMYQAALQGQIGRVPLCMSQFPYSGQAATFSASYGIATALAQGQISIMAVIVEPILEILLSLVLGSIMGWFLSLIELFFHSSTERTTISVAFVLMTVGLSMTEFHIGPIHCCFSLLLVCMMAGTVFCNICKSSEDLMNRIDGWTMPLNILFFVISGAELDLEVLSHPVTILVGMVYIIARSAGKYFGSSVSCTLTKQSKPITDNLGITLLPQAGVALGMALTVASLPDGYLARNVVLFAVLVYELIAPTLTKRSLVAVGEIQIENHIHIHIHTHRLKRV